ncbi:uncharacterized protein TRAVEDRAFT_48167 [Trametes versicolor FP-101664 SS1]|uniref:uncharacterized protein n=1 Tax=Trametes versicolor (strain FP-101664) TaxID=717944 RepID=UPI0004621ADD|nr:uncharacterized protein TRAVEDRAFT_48167 [Trametes versicolor FP-101664 SS1]EIW59040.1 hypothetical protein TRAVEDRAFT_48167 [Trametes versicolor FP-101664 SS1]
MSNSDRMMTPPSTPGPSTNARASPSSSRTPPPKLRLKDKETTPSRLAHLVLNLLFPDNSAFVFSEEDEAEFRWYSQHNRDLQERRARLERETTEDDPALANTSQSVHMGARPAEVAQDMYNRPPVRRTPLLRRPLHRRYRSKGGAGREATGLALPSLGRIDEVGEDEDARDGTVSSDDGKTIQTASEDVTSRGSPASDGAPRADAPRRPR